MKVQFSRNFWLKRQSNPGEMGDDGKDGGAGWNIGAESKINLLRAVLWLSFVIIMND